MSTFLLFGSVRGRPSPWCRPGTRWRGSSSRFSARRGHRWPTPAVARLPAGRSRVTKSWSPGLSSRCRSTGRVARSPRSASGSVTCSAPDPCPSSGEPRPTTTSDRISSSGAGCGGAPERRGQSIRSECRRPTAKDRRPFSSNHSPPYSAPAAHAWRHGIRCSAAEMSWSRTDSSPVRKTFPRFRASG